MPLKKRLLSLAKLFHRINISFASAVDDLRKRTRSGSFLKSSRVLLFIAFSFCQRDSLIFEAATTASKATFFSLKSDKLNDASN